jgi:hypothetical protein|tara:strand:- start:20297 stop:20512 length:216 start_codon:yes stop_codon:yes gene_type:complete
MTDKEMTKKEMKGQLDKLTAEIEKTTEQLREVSIGYQNVVQSNNALSMLVMKYEETINILTSRLIEARPQS